MEKYAFDMQTEVFSAHTIAMIRRNREQLVAQKKNSEIKELSRNISSQCEQIKSIF